MSQLIWILNESWGFHINSLLFQVTESSGSPAGFIQRRSRWVSALLSVCKEHLYIVCSENLCGTSSWRHIFHLCFQAFFTAHVYPPNNLLALPGVITRALLTAALLLPPPSCQNCWLARSYPPDEYLYKCCVPPGWFWWGFWLYLLSIMGSTHANGAGCC